MKRIVKEMCAGGDRQKFCEAYLRTMDPERAAAKAGCRDGFSALSRKSVQEQLEKMREAASGPLKREDVLRRLAQLAFGRVNDAIRLALHEGTYDPDELALSAVAEFKATDKGLEVKFVDRVRALEALYSLLGDGAGDGAVDFFQALEDAGNE